MTEQLHAPADIARAAEILRKGGLVSFGTETVYGLGADARNGDAVARIYAAKGRPSFNPLICHFAEAGAAFRVVEPNSLAMKLAAKFWPGPLTLVLPCRSGAGVSSLAAAGLPTLAVRVPAQAAALALLRAFGGPVAAPSANSSGRVSPTTAAHVLADLNGRIDAVLDTGPCGVGLESTVLDLTGPRPCLLRPGGVSVEALEEITGPLLRAAETSDAPASPGMLLSHYAPSLPVRLNATSVTETEALLAFGPPLPGARAVFQLSLRGDLAEAASRLFEGLHVLDVPGFTRIAVMNVPEMGLGLAINDRLRRAAATPPKAR